MTNKTPPEENNGLKWLESGLRWKERINEAAALIETSRYLDRYLKQPVEILIGAGNNFQKDFMSAGVGIATHIMRPFATELAIKAMYEWENDDKKDIQGHNLIKLYNILSPKTQGLLRERYLTISESIQHEFGNQAIPPIEELLKEFQNAFQEERYFTEEAHFKTGYSSPNQGRLDAVVMAAWKTLSEDPKMEARIFNLDALIPIHEQQANKEPHIVRRKPM